MKKSTERYDLAIPVVDEFKVKKSLQLVCDKNEIYPISFSTHKQGVVVRFLRTPQIPQYKYTNILMLCVNELKKELCVPTIVMKKTQGSVDTDNMPEEIKTILDVEPEENNENSELVKKLEEDSSYFNSFINKQILDSDYDSKEGREAIRYVVNKLKNQGKFHILCQEEGQIEFDLAQYS